MGAEMLRCAQHDRAMPDCRMLARRIGLPQVSAHAQPGQRTARHAVDGSGAGRGRLGSRVAGPRGRRGVPSMGESSSLRPLNSSPNPGCCAASVDAYYRQCIGPPGGFPNIQLSPVIFLNQVANLSLR